MSMIASSEIQADVDQYKSESKQSGQWVMAKRELAEND